MVIHTVWSTNGFVDLIVAIISVLSLCCLSNGQTCTQINNCACQFADGTTIDISSVGKQSGSPRFGYEQPPGDPSSHWEYAFNPCFKFSDKFCKKVVSCQRSTDKKTSWSLGTAESASWSSDGKAVTYESVGKDGITRTSVLTLVCDSNGSPDNPSFVRNGEDQPGSGQYDYQLTSICACPDGCEPAKPISTGGLSAGSILCILFVVLVFVYLLGGMVYMKVVKKAEGKEVIPNVNFWMDFHNYVKDGFLFVTSKCRRPQYDSM